MYVLVLVWNDADRRLVCSRYARLDAASEKSANVLPPITCRVLGCVHNMDSQQ